MSEQNYTPTLKLPLQYFAEGDNPGTEPAPAPPAPATEPPKVDPQVEAQKIADAIVAKKLAGMPSKDEMKAFKQWQQSQKSAEEIAADKLKELEKQRDTFQRQAEGFEREKATLKAGVATQYAEFVAYQVGTLVTETKDFATALKEYLVSNPQYKADGAEPTPPPVSRPASGVTTDKPTGKANEALRSILRK